MEALSLDVMLQSLRQVGITVIAIVLLTIVLEIGLYILFVRILKHKYALPIMLLSPAVIGLTLLYIYPIGYEISLAFSNMSLDNFKRSYNITEQSLTKLQEEGIPPETLTKLQGLTEQEFSSEETFLNELETILGQQPIETHKEQLLKAAQKKQQVTITRESLSKLREHNVPDDILAQLEQIVHKEYSSEKSLLGEVKTLLGEEAMTAYADLFSEYAQKTTTFKITKRSLFTLRKHLPEDLLAKLKDEKGLLNRTYFSEEEFLRDIEHTVGSDQIARYQSAFLTHALENPGPTFGISEGIRNFKRIFTEPVLKQVHFFRVLWRTVLWTAIQVPTHVILGLGLAMLLNRPMRLRGLYRTLIVVPWAIPQVIAVLVWRGEFDLNYGFINILLRSIGFAAIPWKTDPFWNFVAINITNIWLGIPFMMVILLGGLQSIPNTYYEAADVDGARKWDKFRHITLPLIQPVMTPAVILGVIWTFNNFNVPFLINQNELESSDILVTALFRAAFEYNRYGFSAAFALVIFLILLGFCLIYMRLVKLDLGVTAGKKKKA